jgi:tRNA uridine 5-carbamoylmethylation protein Kti12
MDKAEKKLIELIIIVDLSTSQYLPIDLPKLNSLVEEIFELIPTTLKTAEEEEEKRIEEVMKEFMNET